MLMDSQTYIVESVLTLAPLAAIIGAWLYMRQRTSTDRYREQLFTLRDELFDYMWKNNIPFDLPAYRRTRAYINGAIRVAGTITPARMLAVRWAIRRSEGVGTDVGRVIDEIEKSTHRKQFKNTWEKLNGMTTEFILLHRAPFTFIMLVTLTVVAVSFGRIRNTSASNGRSLILFGEDDIIAREICEKRQRTKVTA